MSGVDYTFQDGDTLGSVAKTFGTTKSTIWKHERNAEVRKQRGKYSKIKAGDEFFIPQPEVTTVSYVSKTSFGDQALCVEQLGQLEEKLEELMKKELKGYMVRVLADETVLPAEVLDPEQISDVCEDTFPCLWVTFSFTKAPKTLPNLELEFELQEL